MNLLRANDRSGCITCISMPYHRSELRKRRVIHPSCITCKLWTVGTPSELRKLNPTRVYHPLPTTWVGRTSHTTPTHGVVGAERR